MRRRYSERDRERFLAEMRRTGDAVGAVARRVGISNSTAYRWWEAERGAHSDKTSAAIQFATLVRSSSVAAVGSRGLVVTVGSARVAVEPGFDARLLRSVVAALSEEAES